VHATLDAHEITVLLSGVFLIACSVRFRLELRRVPEWRLLLCAIGCLTAGNLATIVEHFWAYEFFNALEHFCYFSQSLTVALWALRVRSLRKTPAC
jgi:uncharacterized membrane protein